MKDFYGKTLRVGDFVIYGRPNTKRERFLGKVDEVQESCIFLRLTYEETHYMWTYPHNVVKVNPEEATYLRLKGSL